MKGEKGEFRMTQFTGSAITKNVEVPKFNQGLINKAHIHLQ